MTKSLPRLSAFISCFLLGCVMASAAIAGVPSTLLREAIATVERKFGREVVEEFGDKGGAVLARKVEALAARHGEEVVAEAVQKVGPQLFRYVEEIGEDGTLQALRLMSREGNDAIWVVSKPGRFRLFFDYGDDAADAMIKHGEIAESLIGQFGQPGAKAMAAVNTQQQAVRLARMASEGDLARMAQTTEILGIIGRYGDEAADWVWRHKGALAVATVATAFVANPQPFIDGAVDVVEVGTTYVIGPVAEAAAKSINWTLLGAGLLLVVLVLGWKLTWKKLWRRH